MSKRIFITLSFILAVVCYGEYTKDKINNVLSESSAEEILKVVPKANLIDLKTGKVVDLTQVNKAVLVHFWATWCGPCEKELPDIIKYAQKNKTRMHLYLVAVNDKDHVVKKFLKKFKAYEESFTVLKDNADIHTSKYGTYKLPETYLFKKDGKIVKKFVGPQDWLTSYYQNFVQYLK